jgi:hypothetical protein
MQTHIAAQLMKGQSLPESRSLDIVERSTSARGCWDSQSNKISVTNASEELCTW